ncbi:hypothetical protein C1645_810597 [Glomus cerebriforme]|uniref:Uncharacterized protein n=1 Tax=Glomus cerebriforme TaxID=658196 RepID=A0A397S0R3_9GLOM|nr:hypothetical protein C1645_810597 [Glomus cerebriforme]
MKFAEIKSKNAEIPELRRKVADIEAENAKLRQIIEKNAKHDVRVKELEQKNTELESRKAEPIFAILLNFWLTCWTLEVLPDNSYELDFGQKILILPDKSYKWTIEF